MAARQEPGQHTLLAYPKVNWLHTYTEEFVTSLGLEPNLSNHPNRAT
ncbi:MAG: hypothetical protein ACJZ1Y_01935 [Candidatus Neomarinimicrobiota bacterium]